MDDNPTRRRGPLLWLAGRSRAFWIVATFAAPALYLAAFGPVCWLSAREIDGPRLVIALYRPVLRLGVNEQIGNAGLVGRAARCYSEIGTGKTAGAPLHVWIGRDGGELVWEYAKPKPKPQ